MTDQLPEPLVPAEVDLRDFAFMPLDVARLRDSDLVAEPDGEVFRSNVLSWCVSWHQIPAGSLPDDDATLARLLGYGRDLRSWRKIRAAGGLRGWVKCSDGRLYHPVVAEKATEAWERKIAQRQRTEAARNARLQRQPQSLSQDDDQSVTGSNRQGQGQRQGHKESSLRSEAHKGTRLPDDWKPDHALMTWAVNNLPEQLDVDRETEKFRNYWHAATGAKATKRDWPATWRNWMLTAAERMPGARRPQQQQHRSGFAAMQSEMQRRDQQEAFTLEGTARRVDD